MTLQAGEKYQLAVISSVNSLGASSRGTLIPRSFYRKFRLRGNGPAAESAESCFCPTAIFVGISENTQLQIEHGGFRQNNRGIKPSRIDVTVDLGLRS